ncbi:MAG: Mov34/MPN/PAD-1 family protein [Phycisphaerae bacterium]
MTTEVFISPAALDAALDHARRAAPNECVGLLLGRRRAIAEALPIRSVHPGPTSFAADPLELAAGEEDAGRRGLCLCGYYHSHPAAPAVPSDRDRLGEPWPGLGPSLRMIVSLLDRADPDVRVYASGHNGWKALKWNVAASTLIAGS